MKLRDQKQLDFEELSDYLSGVTLERDRLSAVISGHAGSSGLGLSAYLKDKVDAIRGADDDRSRVEKMRKLDVKIKEVCTPDLTFFVSNSTPFCVLAARCSYHCTRHLGCIQRRNSTGTEDIPVHEGGRNEGDAQ